MLSVKARKRKAQLAGRARAKAHGGGATAAQHEAVSGAFSALFAQSVIHVLGKAEGRALCGATLPGAPANPLQDAWGPIDKRRGAFAGLQESMAGAVSAFPGSAAECSACLANVGRMQAADEAKASGQRGAARTKATPIERELMKEVQDASDDESIA